MAQSFDLVVIGTGSAATTVATTCREAGRQVAVVDSRPYGGTCAIRGCDPKKVLVGAADVLDWFRRMDGKGVRGDSVRIDWPALMAFKRTFTDPVPSSREELFSKTGIAKFHGRARFTAPDRLDVDGQALEAKHFVIATGAKPAALGIDGERLIKTSDDFLELEHIPDQIAFAGGGYIAFEFAHIAARAGARVTILHRGKRPLEHFDAELVERLARHSRTLNIDIRLGAQVTSIEQTDHGYRVHAQAGDQPVAVDSQLVIHGAGRVPDIDDLDLSAAKVERAPKGIKVNEYLQSTSNPAVYAAGDAAASGAPLTPVAGYHGRIVAENLLHGNRLQPDYSGLSSVVFTVPPLAAVGLTEQGASARKLKFKVNRGDTSGWYSSKRVAETCAGYKVIVEEGTEKILGAHLLGGGAEELINVFALAVKKGMTAGEVKDVLYAYPTHASDIQYML